MSQRALIPHWPGLSWVSVSGWIRYLSIENCCSFFITFNQSISQSIKLYWSLAGNQWTNGEYNNTYVSARSLSWWRFVCGCNQRAKCAVFLHLSRWLTFPMYYKYWSHYLNIYCECIWTISIKKNVPKFQTSERRVALVLFVDWNSCSFSFQPAATDSKANTIKLSQTGLFSPSASIFLTRDPCGPCQKLVRRVSSNG